MTEQEKNYVFHVSYPDPAEGMKALDRTRFEFECLLDYMAANHPAALLEEFGPELSTLREEMEEDIYGVWMKHL